MGLCLKRCCAQSCLYLRCGRSWAWEHDFEWRRVFSGRLAYAGVLIPVLLYGGARMAIFASQSNTVRVATLVETADYFGFMDAEGMLASLEYNRELGDLMLEQARQQAQARVLEILFRN